MYLTRLRINSARAEARRLLNSPHRLHGAVDMAFPNPAARDGTGPRVLWRLDAAPGNRVDLFISSPDRPDLTHLVEQVGWPSLGQEGWTTFAYGEFLNALAEGDVWSFRLTANPVHHIRRDQDPVGAPTKRAAHVTVRHQIGWLLKQQERAGFRVLPKGDSSAASGEGGAGADGSATHAGIMGDTDPDGRPTAAGAVPASVGTTEEWGYQLVVHDRTPVRFGKPSGGTRDSASPSRPHVHFTRATFDGRLRITDLAAFRHTLTHGLGKAKAYGCGLMTLTPGR
ncbi:type I-E CRISPR-associated protein Cas6/Cse3/CasE [Streptomyces sulfonofaciens]|uniref:Type I-E CRISPR-associated protein Cas6/Cse3/CasE n=1 Tax=Streptomyces sulfonofaciens TaxID=68272 RepID=A0A919GKR9_9ACTN|nr:type I-E CRISPR-associated protein Cas6/Cse3/CasE [Streptomyces sulfonofaciens]GHH85818.1 type I-E CRISPR-associated protein Cas6/Cse3/CasE [Streptomyces sulfonofaciens]